MNRWITGWVVLLLLLLPLPLAAQGIVNLVVQGNEVHAGISLPANITADLTISFEQAEGLSAESIGLSASLVSLTDTQLLARLREVSIPSAFPVLIRIQPPAEGSLSFQGVASIEVHTHLLPFTLNTPLRLYAAPEGGLFRDITASVGMGSYRAVGRKGSFSELLILVDLRTANQVIAQKLDILDQLLADHEAAIAPAVFSDLSALAAEIRSKHSAGRTQAAISKTEEFVALVQAHSGADIPDVWRSARDLTNVAGLLRAAGETLRFSLIMKQQQQGGLLGGLL
ncbi:MAG TPA: DUF6689 family protein [Thermoanaerobaculia bacterium]|nr:DUF6689 family protein [Thermoanaerobaculia bacterium]